MEHQNKGIYDDSQVISNKKKKRNKITCQLEKEPEKLIWLFPLHFSTS